MAGFTKPPGIPRTSTGNTGSAPAPGGKNVSTPGIGGDEEEENTNTTPAMPGQNMEQRAQQNARQAGTLPNAGAAGNMAGREQALRAGFDPNKQHSMNDAAMMSSKAGRRAEAASRDYDRRTPGRIGASSGGSGFTPQKKWDEMFPNRDTMGTEAAPFTPPAATNVKPGDAGANSLADKVPVTNKPVPVPGTNPDGSKGPAPSVADNLAYYKGTTQPANPAASPLHPNNEDTGLSAQARAFENAEKAKEDTSSPEQSARIASQFAAPKAAPVVNNGPVQIGQPLATTHENVSNGGMAVAQPKPTGQLGIENFNPNVQTPNPTDDLHGQIAQATQPAASPLHPNNESTEDDEDAKKFGSNVSSSVVRRLSYQAPASSSAASRSGSDGGSR